MKNLGSDTFEWLGGTLNFTAAHDGSVALLTAIRTERDTAGGMSP